MKFLLPRGTKIARSVNGHSFHTVTTTVDAYYREEEVERTINPHLRQIALPQSALPYRWIRVRAEFLQAIAQSRVMAISLELLDSLKIVDAEELSHLFMLQPNERIISIEQDPFHHCMKVRTEIR